MTGHKWQRPGWKGADGDRNLDRQQNPNAGPPPPPPVQADPRTGWHYMTAEGRIAGPFANPDEAKADAFRRREQSYQICAPRPADPEPPEAPEPEAPAISEGDPPTTGWHYTDTECPDEGAVGPFATAGEAATHASEAYPEGGFDLHPPVKKEDSDAGT